MKYLLLFIALFLALCGLVSKFYKPTLPKEFIALVDNQQNPFKVHRDSGQKIWSRALAYLESRKGLISGGNLHVTDSVIYMPYYNSYHKGSSLKIEQHVKGDSTQFYVIWWYSGNALETGSKEIALYMQHGIERYSFKK